MLFDNARGADVNHDAKGQNTTHTGNSNGGNQGDNTGKVVLPSGGDVNPKSTATVVPAPVKHSQTMAELMRHEH